MDFITKTEWEVDVTGIDTQQITNLPIEMAGGFTRLQWTEILVILNQYAYVLNSITIHSILEHETLMNTVDEKSIRAANGTQAIHTKDGYVIPLSIKMCVEFYCDKNGVLCMAAKK